ncbi:solute carrier family 22 member 4-like [Conger conger]|uniref:solute carrier family 22 member 4-like n=1 Tax=Conger conger TaxID=82655 RepID=UPI002A5A5114|nr:solute carrier family 22 member 4-like [Conger conger]
MHAASYDDVTEFVGEWGHFQKRIMLLICLSIVPNGLTCFSVVFLADTPPHHCLIPPNANISAEWRNYSIPLEEDDGEMRYSKCTRYKLDVIKCLSDNGSVPGIHVNVPEIEQESCQDGWEYDRDIYVSTIVSEWDLVCTDAWKVPITSSLYFFGVLTGCFISGQLSDRFGRKIILFATMAVQTLFAFFQTFSTSWLMFSALFFVVGMGETSNYLIAFVLGTEILSPSTRMVFSTVGVCISFSIGYMMIPLMAFFIRDWRMLSLYYFSLKLALQVHRCWVENKMKSCKHYNICDLVQSVNIRWITSILSFVWVIVTIGYFALSLNTSNLHGDHFLNFFFSAAVEVPAYILSWPLFRSCPRRLCLSPMLVFGGAVLLVTRLIPRDLSSVCTALEMMGKFGVTLAFTLVYAYTPELYPTVLRNTAMGTCSTAARLGSIAAPYFVYLGTYYKSLPYILMGSLSVLGGLVSLLLPETYGMPLPETIDHMQTIQRFEVGIYCTGDDGEILDHTGFHLLTTLHVGAVPHSPEDHRNGRLLHTTTIRFSMTHLVAQKKYKLAGARTVVH